MQVLRLAVVCQWAVYTSDALDVGEPGHPALRHEPRTGPA